MKMNELWRLRGRASATIGFYVLAGIVAVSLAYAITVYAQHRMPGQPIKEDRNHPWMNASLSPDERADMVLKEMTLDEKIDLLHGMGMPGWPESAFCTESMASARIALAMSLWVASGNRRSSVKLSDIVPPM